MRSRWHRQSEFKSVFMGFRAGDTTIHSAYYLRVKGRNQLVRRTKLAGP
jgi:hypothetical protein